MGYTVYQADLEKDKNSILKFWRENHQRSLEEKYQWIYEENPAGKAKVWMLKHDKSEECVGMTALFSRNFSVKGKGLVAGIAGDFLVNKHHRTMGPAIMLQRNVIVAVDNGHVDFVYGFPNKKAEPIMKRVGYRRIGTLRRFVKIIKSAHQLRKRGFNELWVKILSPLLDIVLILTSIETWYRWRSGFVCEEVNDLDGRFDRMWVNAKSQFTIAGDRTADYLKWKFLDDPDDLNRVYAIFNSDKSCVKGYIVYCFHDNGVEIRDFVFPEDKKATLVLMGSFLRNVRSFAQDSVVVNCLDNSHMIKAMKRFGFMKGKSGRSVYLYCTEDVWNDLPLLRSPDNWMLMKSDEDT